MSPGLPVPRWPGEFALLAWVWSGVALTAVGIALTVLLARRTRASLDRATNERRTYEGPTYEGSRK